MAVINGYTHQRATRNEPVRRPHENKQKTTQPQGVYAPLILSISAGIEQPIIALCAIRIKSSLSSPRVQEMAIKNCRAFLVGQATMLQILIISLRSLRLKAQKSVQICKKMRKNRQKAEKKMQKKKGNQPIRLSGSGNQALRISALWWGKPHPTYHCVTREIRGYRLLSLCPRWALWPKNLRKSVKSAVKADFHLTANNLSSIISA